MRTHNIQNGGLASLRGASLPHVTLSRAQSNGLDSRGGGICPHGNDMNVGPTCRAIRYRGLNLISMPRVHSCSALIVITIISMVKNVSNKTVSGTIRNNLNESDIDFFTISNLATFTLFTVGATSNLGAYSLL